MPEGHARLRPARSGRTCQKGKPCFASWWRAEMLQFFFPLLPYAAPAFSRSLASATSRSAFWEIEQVESELSTLVAFWTDNDVEIRQDFAASVGQVEGALCRLVAAAVGALVSLSRGDGGCRRRIRELAHPLGRLVAKLAGSDGVVRGTAMRGLDWLARIPDEEDGRRVEGELCRLVALLAERQEREAKVRLHEEVGRQIGRVEGALCRLVALLTDSDAREIAAMLESARLRLGRADGVFRDLVALLADCNASVRRTAEYDLANLFDDYPTRKLCVNQLLNTAPSCRWRIIGGGPVGLTLASRLGLYMDQLGWAPDQACVVVCELRIQFNKTTGLWTRRGCGRRRDQVVTLQDKVVGLLPEALQGIFEGEKVWLSSRNVAVADLEDRLLTIVQENAALKKYVRIEDYGLTGDNDEERLANHRSWIEHLDCDVVVFADGAASLSRRAFGQAFASNGSDRIALGAVVPDLVRTDFSLGVGLKGDVKVPQAQALNVVFTLMQQRYLLNSQQGRDGYLNIRITEAEYNQVFQATGQRGCQFGSPIVLYDEFTEKTAAMLREPVPWLSRTIEDGLSLYGMQRQHIRDIVGIQISPAYVEQYFHVLQGDRPKTLVCVGDAAMSHHFWPGRGLNTGLKGAEALFRAWSGSGSRLPEYQLCRLNAFMNRLREREMQGRSASMLRRENTLPPIIDQMLIPGDDSRSQFASMSANEEINLRELEAKAKRWRDIMESRGDAWPHARITNKDLEMHMRRTARPSAVAAHIMNQSGIWPIEQQRGPEVSPADHDWALVVNHFDDAQ